MTNNSHLTQALLAITALGSPSLISAEDWTVNTAAEWAAAIQTNEGLTVEGDTLYPSKASGKLATKIQTFAEKRSAASLTISQSALWQNWNPTSNVGPSNLSDAPVFLSKGPDDYWLFGRYRSATQGKKRGGKKAAPNPAAPAFEAKAATLEGFDVPLLTTPLPNQYNAPGGLQPPLGGYHAWQSRDMKNWVHHGPVTERFSCWVTTAEFKDGKTYLYYDYPNDQDPHLYIDDDLTDGKPGENKGMAFKDPSHGSDCAFIRDAEGNFHVIYEDWSPINASERSWDSPLAGHAVSSDGIGDFSILKPAVDQRTKPTGVIKSYPHPHWLEHENWDTNIGEYEVHTPAQEAYGDWASIAIGGQYYLFGDYDPASGHEMSVGWFTSSSLDEQFTWCDNIGKGHPDPDIAFAEGQFYLVTQQKTDYISPGPWVETVSARVGVDTDNDAQIDQWTDWQELKEHYDHTEGRAKQIQKTPAQMDLTSLPEGFGFQVEIKVKDSTKNKSKPILEGLQLSFQ